MEMWDKAAVIAHYRIHYKIEGFQAMTREMTIKRQLAMQSDED